MSSGQRITKVIADILAVWLIVCIFSGIGTALLAVIGFSEIKQSVDNVSGEMEAIGISQDIEKVDIDIASASVYIKSGETFACQTNDKGFSFSEKKGKLKIEEKNLKLFSGFGEAIIVITVPEYVILESFKIDSGTGLLSMENISCKKLTVDSGIGETSIEHVTVTEAADIEGGVGDLQIKKGTINILELSVGMGKTELNTHLTGVSEIQGGVGEISMHNTMSAENYTLSVEKGIGEVLVAGEKLKSDKTVGTGSNIINVEGGLGNMNITFEDAA